MVHEYVHVQQALQGLQCISSGQDMEETERQLRARHEYEAMTVGGRMAYAIIDAGLREDILPYAQEVSDWKQYLADHHPGTTVGPYLPPQS